MTAEERRKFRRNTQQYWQTQYALCDLLGPYDRAEARWNAVRAEYARLTLELRRLEGELPQGIEFYP